MTTDYPHGPSEFSKAKPGDRVLLVSRKDADETHKIVVNSSMETMIESTNLNAFGCEKFDLFLQVPPLPPKPAAYIEAERRWPKFRNDPDHARACSIFVQGAKWARPLVAAEIADKFIRRGDTQPAITVRAMFPVEGQDGAGS